MAESMRSRRLEASFAVSAAKTPLPLLVGGEVLGLRLLQRGREGRDRVVVRAALAPGEYGEVDALLEAVRQAVLPLGAKPVRTLELQHLVVVEEVVPLDAAKGPGQHPPPPL